MKDVNYVFHCSGPAQVGRPSAARLGNPRQSGQPLSQRAPCVVDATALRQRKWSVRWHGTGAQDSGNGVEGSVAVALVTGLLVLSAGSVGSAFMRCADRVEEAHRARASARMSTISREAPLPQQQTSWTVTAEIEQEMGDTNMSDIDESGRVSALQYASPTTNQWLNWSFLCPRLECISLPSIIRWYGFRSERKKEGARRLVPYLVVVSLIGVIFSVPICYCCCRWQKKATEGLIPAFLGGARWLGLAPFLDRFLAVEVTLRL